MSEFIQNQRGPRHEVVMRKGVVNGGLGVGETKEEKQQSPTVDHKELYSIFSDKPNEKE